MLSEPVVLGADGALISKEICDVESTSDATFPEGGSTAWMTMLGVFLVQFVTFGYTNAHGVYNDFYVREYLVETATASQISWIGSTQLFFVMASGLVSGTAFDAGYFYSLMIGGSFLFVFCLFAISLSQPEHFYQVYLAQGFGLGIAIGIMYIPGVGIVSHYFQRRRALVIGLVTSGSAVGGAIQPIILNAWFHGSVGFHRGVRASAGLTGGLLVIAILLMKPRYPEKKKKTEKIINSFKNFLRDPPYVIMVFGTVMAVAGLYYPIYFIQLNAIKSGVNPHLAFYTIAVLNGASVVGRVMSNTLASKIGPFNVMIPGFYLVSILVFCSLGVRDITGVMIFAVLFGFFSGTYASGLPTMVGSTAENDAEIGARLGVCFTFTGIGGLLGTPIAGALLSTTFVWWRPTLFAGLSTFVAATCFLITRILISKKKGTNWL